MNILYIDRLKFLYIFQNALLTLLIEKNIYRGLPKLALYCTT